MPGAGRTFRKTFAASPAAVGPVRAQVAQLAAAAGAEPARVDEIRLAVSEAITNAVVHGCHGGPGRITVQASVSRGQLWVTVADDGAALRAGPDRPGLGLGLGLISGLSDDFSILARASGGTEVRIRFELELIRDDHARVSPVADAVAA
jgi:anti-sigma regulatory factor (Ser/Thr protein kinase)